jgi:hypothetical protein
MASAAQWPSVSVNAIAGVNASAAAKAPDANCFGSRNRCIENPLSSHFVVLGWKKIRCPQRAAVLHFQNWQRLHYNKNAAAGQEPAADFQK